MLSVEACGSLGLSVIFKKDYKVYKDLINPSIYT